MAILIGLIELKLLTVTEYDLKDEKIPDSFKGKKIALVSDLHGVYHGRDNVRLIEKIKGINPDYIVVTGDVINGRSTTELRYTEHILGSFAGMGKPVIYTFGNHEEKLAVNLADRKAYDKLIEISENNSILLNDKCFCPDEDIDVCFVGINLPLWLYHDHDRTGMLKGRIQEIVGAAEADKKYKILLVHDPEHFDNYAESGVNLCLCGHLHGGIVRFPLLGGLITPRLQVFTKRSKGFFEKGNMKMIISGGVGWHDFPMRIMNRPEIVVINFL